MRIEIFILNQSDDLPCPVHQTEKTNCQHRSQTRLALNLSAIKLPTVDTTVLSSPSTMESVVRLTVKDKHWRVVPVEENNGERFISNLY